MIVTLSISLMLGVRDAPAAAHWYTTALGARELWNLGSVIGLEIRGAPFFIHEATGEWLTSPLVSPSVIGQTTVRVEVLVDDPDDFIDKAVAAGATDSGDGVRERRVPWGLHRQGGFVDPFGHVWLVGDRSPLETHSS